MPATGAEQPAQPTPAAAEPGEPAPKQISAWVDGGTPPAVDVALDLLVRIGDPVAETVFTPDQPTALAASDIPPEGLDTEWTVCTPDATFAPADPVSALPQSAGLPGGAVRFPLHVPQAGDSDTVTVTLTPLRTPYGSSSASAPSAACTARCTRPCTARASRPTPTPRPSTATSC